MNILMSFEENKVVVFLNSVCITLSCAVRYALSHYTFTDGDVFFNAYDIK